MKKFCRKVFAFVISLCILLVGYCKLASVAGNVYYGKNTAEKIQMSFHDAVAGNYNCYFLGNSRIYRGINPAMFSVHAYNFAHDNDSYNQMYYKLLYLINHGCNIDYLVVGTDYFLFSYCSDSRNYVYSMLFPEPYSADYMENSYSRYLKYILQYWEGKKNCLSACRKYLLRIAPQDVPYQKDNGQFVEIGNATETDIVNRDYSIMDMQYKYYLKIIEACMENDINLYIVMPPLWKAEIAGHSEEERKAFDEMIKGSLANTPYEDHYINYNEENGLSSYEDFIDTTHLKPEAADRFSAYINHRIFE